jgi:hypothetical protein
MFVSTVVSQNENEPGTNTAQENNLRRMGPVLTLLGQSYPFIVTGEHRAAPCLSLIPCNYLTGMYAQLNSPVALLKL